MSQLHLSHSHNTPVSHNTTVTQHTCHSHNTPVTTTTPVWQHTCRTTTTHVSQSTHLSHTHSTPVTQVKSPHPRVLCLIHLIVGQETALTEATLTGVGVTPPPSYVTHLIVGQETALTGVGAGSPGPWRRQPRGRCGGGKREGEGAGRKWGCRWPACAWGSLGWSSSEPPSPAHTAPVGTIRMGADSTCSVASLCVCVRACIHVCMRWILAICICKERVSA